METLLTNFKRHENVANYKQKGYERISEKRSKETLKFKSVNMIPYFDSKFLELTVL